MSSVKLKNDFDQFFILVRRARSRIVIALPFLSIKPSSLKSDSVRLTVSVADYLSEIADDQRQLDPLRWITAETEYLLNTNDKAADDTDKERMEVISEAKQRLTKTLLTQNDVMEMFDISKSTLGKWRSDGLHFNKQGKFVYFDIKDLELFLKREAA